MKTKYVNSIASLALLAGCALPSRKATLDLRLREESRALTTAVVDVLNSQPTASRDIYTLSALEFARQDQRIEGLPLKPFATTALLATNTNLSPAIAAQQQSEAKAEFRQRFHYQDQLLARATSVDEKLIASGLIREEERVARWRFWLKWLGGGSILLGGFIALCLFFPVAIPIVGRLLAWFVSKIPALAGTAGVVSVKAFDAIVRGIEQTKSTSTNVALGNDSTERAPFDPSALHLNLSRAMDASHKALVRKRKPLAT